MTPAATPARPAGILPAIVFSQFAGTSLWFAGNAVADDLGNGMDPAWLASAVQLGFIAGTLLSVRLRLADRYRAASLFLACCCAGALFNYPLTALAQDAGAYGPYAVLALRFLVGMALAGIYPVGIKVAASWYQEGLGKALGYLTGALVLGTAFPHLVRGLGAEFGWHAVLGASSALAVIGGVVLRLAVPEGPHARREAAAQQGASLRQAWRERPRMRAAASGYFGHMWELYAFWAFVPLYLAGHYAAQPPGAAALSLWTFAVIAAGALGCIGGGEISQRRGSAPVAFAQLSVSGACCLLSPLAYGLPTPLVLAFLLVWGVAVVGDSPQFSALNAREAPPQQMGSIVTLVNCIGFSITVASIQLLGGLAGAIDARYLMLPLAAGPLIGLVLFGRVYFGAAARRH